MRGGDIVPSRMYVELSLLHIKKTRLIVHTVHDTPFHSNL